MKYIIDKEKKYTEDILRHLRAHNFSFTGERPNYGKYLYKSDSGKLNAGMKTWLSWDWVNVSDVIYDNLESLKELVQKACAIYSEDAVGLKFHSSFINVIDDLESIGFLKTGCIKLSPIMNNYYFVELRNLSEMAVTESEVIVQEDANEDFDKIMKDNTLSLKKKYGEKDSSEEITIVALDGDNFAGGAVGELYDDHMYVDLLVVTEEYRGKSIGTDLMNRLESELSEKIKTISLGTIEFQARGFYEKLGYRTIVTRTDFPKGFEAYTMLKDIS